MSFFDYRDGARVAILVWKKEFEENLNKMWRIYQSGVTMQIVEYNKQLDKIKDTGLRIFRNSVGKHKIVSR